MLKIWGRLSSINVRKVLWAAGEVGIAFERIDAGANFGIVGTPEYGRMNPNRLVPAIEDDGFVLWESNAIVRYLAARYGAGTLMPTDLQTRFRAEQWMDWQQTTLNPAGRDAFVQLIRKAEGARDPDLVEASRATAEPLFALLDRHLAQRPYIAGAAFTMADIPLACEAHRWFGLPLARPSWPHLERWYAEVSGRSAASSVLVLPLK
jgi:glutathione S-transferase